VDLRTSARGYLSSTGVKVLTQKKKNPPKKTPKTKNKPHRGRGRTSWGRGNRAKPEGVKSGERGGTMQEGLNRKTLPVSAFRLEGDVTGNMTRFLGGLSDGQNCRVMGRGEKWGEGEGTRQDDFIDAESVGGHGIGVQRQLDSKKSIGNRGVDKKRMAWKQVSEETSES